MRERRLVDTIFHKVAVGMILLINFGFGCEIDMGIIWGHLRRPIAPGIGFLCQFLIMPLVRQPFSLLKYFLCNLFLFILY